MPPTTSRGSRYSPPTILVIGALLMVMVLISVSAYLRLSSSGLGCSPWPQCYGHIGIDHPRDTAQIQLTPDKEYADKLLRDLSNPENWATPVHRITASALAILIFIIAIQVSLHRRQGAPVAITYSLLALTLFLAILGISSGGLHLPAITLGNLLGGFAMLALLWVLLLDTKCFDKKSCPQSGLYRWTVIGVILVIVQIILGGLTSTHFAALACTSFPDCHGAWLPDHNIWSSLNIFSAIEINDKGEVITHAGQQAIHILHRLGAWINLVVISGIAVAALRMDSGYRLSAVLILLLLTIELALGIATVLLQLPTALVVTHNGIAALLLLALLTLQYRIKSIAYQAITNLYPTK